MRPKSDKTKVRQKSRHEITIRHDTEIGKPFEESRYVGRTLGMDLMFGKLPSEHRGPRSYSNTTEDIDGRTETERWTIGEDGLITSAETIISEPRPKAERKKKPASATSCAKRHA